MFSVSYLPTSNSSDISEVSFVVLFPLKLNIADIKQSEGCPTEIVLCLKYPKPEGTALPPSTVNLSEMRSQRSVSVQRCQRKQL